MAWQGRGEEQQRATRAYVKGKPIHNDSPLTHKRWERPAKSSGIVVGTGSAQCRAVCEWSRSRSSGITIAVPNHFPSADGDQITGSEGLLVLSWTLPVT